MDTGGEQLVSVNIQEAMQVGGRARGRRQGMCVWGGGGGVRGWPPRGEGGGAGGGGGWGVGRQGGGGGDGAVGFCALASGRAVARTARVGLSGQGRLATRGSIRAAWTSESLWSELTWGWNMLPPLTILPRVPALTLTLHLSLPLPTLLPPPHPPHTPRPPPPPPPSAPGGHGGRGGPPRGLPRVRHHGGEGGGRTGRVGREGRKGGEGGRWRREREREDGQRGEEGEEGKAEEGNGAGGGILFATRISGGGSQGGSGTAPAAAHTYGRQGTQPVANLAVRPAAASTTQTRPLLSLPCPRPCLPSPPRCASLFTSLLPLPASPSPNSLANHECTVIPRLTASHRLSGWRAGCTCPCTRTWYFRCCHSCWARTTYPRCGWRKVRGRGAGSAGGERGRRGGGRGLGPEIRDSEE